MVLDALQALVKGAIQKLLGVQSQMQGTRALAERALAQWTAAPVVQRGERDERVTVGLSEIK